MTNNQVLLSAMSIFGADIVKDAYLEDEIGHEYRMGYDIINNNEIDMSCARVVVEFTNGNRFRIWSTDCGGVEKIDPLEMVKKLEA